MGQHLEPSLDSIPGSRVSQPKMNETHCEKHAEGNRRHREPEQDDGQSGTQVHRDKPEQRSRIVEKAETKSDGPIQCAMGQTNQDTAPSATSVDKGIADNWFRISTTALL